MPVRVNVAIAEGAPRRIRGLPARELIALARRAARKACERAGVADAEVSIALVGDDEIAELNQRFLAHEGPTDAISFPLWEEGETPVGDVYVGLAQALRQAAENGVTAREEVVRLVVHGTLHVLGWDHEGGDERLAGEMWALQERIVAEVTGP